jgi:hypothetical protein
MQEERDRQTGRGVGHMLAADGPTAGALVTGRAVMRCMGPAAPQTRRMNAVPLYARAAVKQGPMRSPAIVC